MSCPRETDVGAFVLDALEPEERLRIAAHLGDCPVCTRTLTELGTLAPLLAAVRPEDLDLREPVPSELAFQRLRRSAVGARPPRRRNRWLLAAAAAAVVVVGGGIATGVAVTSGPPAPTTVQASAGNVHAWAVIKPKGLGSSIELTLAGVPVGEHCRLVAIGQDGARDSTRSWTVGYEGRASWSGTVGLAPDQLTRLDVVTDDGRTLVTLPA